MILHERVASGFDYEGLMRRIKLGTSAVVCFLGLVGISQSQEPTSVRFITGNNLHQLCDDPSELSQIAAQFFVAGVADASGIEAISEGRAMKVCIRDGVTVRQITDLVCQIAGGRAETRDLPASALTHFALVEAFPCS